MKRLVTLPPRRQQGVAMTELVVMSLVLVPLFLLVPMVAKYQDISHATQMASRYVAFDAMTRNDTMSTWKPVGQLEDEVRRRFFSNSDAPIKTGDVAGDFAANRNPFWSDQLGQPLIAKFSDVTVTFGTGMKAAQADGFTSASDSMPFLMHNQMDLAAKGIYRANVSVKLADLPELAGSYAHTYETFKNIGLTVTRQTSVVVDTWTAKDPTQVESRIDHTTIFPGKAVRQTPGLQTAVDAAVAIVELPACMSGSCKGPKLGQLDFWRDTVPADRLR